MERLYYMIFGWWISKADLRKANFILKSILILSFQNFIFKGQDNPHTLHTGQYVVLGATQQSWNLRHHHPSECVVLSSYLGVSRQILVIQNR
jgi:hypothetical protein